MGFRAGDWAGHDRVLIWWSSIHTLIDLAVWHGVFFFIHQDNAPCHTAISIKVWMEDHQIKTLSWPAQSPGLNPIENLWNVIKRNMDGHKPSNKAKLLEFFFFAPGVTQHQCERLVESIPRRMKIRVIPPNIDF